MAQNFIGMNRGQFTARPGALTVGTATGNTDIELRMDTTKGLTKKDVMLFLCALENYIVSNGVGTETPANAGTDLPPL